MSQHQLEDVFGGFQLKVDLSDQAEGTYVVRISNGSEIAIKRVMKRSGRPDTWGWQKAYGAGA